METSPEKSPPTQMEKTADVAAPPADESSPPPPPPPPPDSSSAPPPSDGSGSPSPPSPPAPGQDNPPPPSPPPPPPSDIAPPPETPANPQPLPPPPEGSSSPGTPPAPPPPDSSSNQSPPLSQSPPPQGSDNNNGNNNNNNGNGNNGELFSPPPPPGNRNSQHGSSPPRSLGPSRSGEGSSSPPSSPSPGNDNSPNIPGIIGVIAGAGLLLLLVVLLCICCKKKKKRKSKFDHMPYFNNDNSPFGGGNGGGGGYYSNVPPQDQYGRNDHVMNMTTAGGGKGGNWGASQTPQAPVSGGQGSTSDSSNMTGPKGPVLPPPHPSMVLGMNQSTFTYDELAVATQGFSDSNLLGQGGFGYVHKGVLPNGKEVAVKSLKVGSGQGEREFQAEVEIISRVHHRYLVSLVGYCSAGGQRLLVYEFLPNNTLEFHLHGKDRPVMDWPTRIKIAMGSAKGLAYLHEDCHPRIIHRDIKAANILLDFSFEAKVADFGLAKLSQDNYTHVSTRVMGTFGYLAPEYASSGKLSEKSDVFSFGVMLLELVTGRRPVDPTGEMEDSLVDWARPLCLKAAQDGDYSQLADPRLEGNYDPQEMARMAACAAAAIRHSARRRPKMSQIVRALEGDVSMDDITDGVRPGQSAYISTSSASSEYDASSYSADMRRFRKLALESKNYQSSEFGHTSEYGLNPSSSSSEEMHKSNGKRSPEL